MKKYLGNFQPEAEELHWATGEIIPRKSGKSCDGTEQPTMYKQKKWVFQGGAPETLVLHFGT